MISPWKLGWLNPKTMSCTGPIAISLPLSPDRWFSPADAPSAAARDTSPGAGGHCVSVGPGPALMGGQMDHPEVEQPVEGEVNGQGREEEAEDLLGHQHAALVELLADPVGPPEHGDVDGDNDREGSDDDTVYTERSSLRRDSDQSDDPGRIEEVRDRQRKDRLLHRVLARPCTAGRVRLVRAENHRDGDDQQDDPAGHAQRTRGEMEQPGQEPTQDQQKDGHGGRGHEHLPHDAGFGGRRHVGGHLEKRHQSDLGSDADQEQEENVDHPGRVYRLQLHCLGLPAQSMRGPVTTLAASGPVAPRASPGTDHSPSCAPGRGDQPRARWLPPAVGGGSPRAVAFTDCGQAWNRRSHKDGQMALKEYEAGTAFPGVVGRTTDESSPAWPRPLRAAAGAPNVLFIVLDDTGFGQFGCYGSPIATPNFDELAAGGLLYTNMHTTALCSPSRSCIITGRNHHANTTAAINELATGYPGYNGSIPFENGFLPEMLLPHGYSTYMVGKYHLLPSEFESGAGPFDRWPLGRGFERFYGFLGGDTSQWTPELVYDNHQVEPPRTPEQGYHLTEDLVDKAIEFIADAKQVAPQKPFYLHFCTGATHAPHHVAKEWADRYAGQFDDGWDAYRERVFARQKDLGLMPADAELSRHDPDVPDWESLSPDARRLATRLMEGYGGLRCDTCAQLGRILDFLKETGQFDNTVIMVVSDNGASPEGGPTGTTNELQFFNNAPEPLEDSIRSIDELGGPTTFNHYPWGWTWAGNTPV